MIPAWTSRSSAVQPGIISIPLAFLLGIVGTFLGKEDEFPEKRVEMEVRSLTGVGVEKTISH